MPPRTVTETIETDGEPDAIVAILIDPKSLPQWAPGFADTIEPLGPAIWRVIKGDRIFEVEVAFERSRRTVDYLREVAPGKKSGAYIRVLPRPGSGSVVVMTLPIPAGGDSNAVTAILKQELSDLVELSQSRTEIQA